MTRRRRPGLSGGNQAQEENMGLADMVQSEIDGDVKSVLGAIHGQFQPADSLAVSSKDYDAYIRANFYAGPDGGKAFRAKILEEIGDTNFWEKSHRAFGYTPPPDSDLPALLGEPGSRPNLASRNAVKAVKEVERDGAGRMKRVVDYDGMSPEMASEMNGGDTGTEDASGDNNG